MKTRNRSEAKESTECSRGSKQQNSLEDSIIHKTETIQFDATTGKKISIQTETKTHKTKQILKQEEWEKIKTQRILALTTFKQMTIQSAKIKSKVFRIYCDYISNALIDLEKLRIKLKLSYNDDSLWYNIDIVQLFVFGVTSDVYDNKPVPDHFQYLTCCWNWAELVEWGKNETLRKRISNDYMLTTNEDCFIVRPAMIGYHVLGCLIANHIPKLSSIMRDKTFTSSKNFPVYKELIIPKDDIQPYNTVVFQYSFSLHEPRLDLPEKDAPFALKDGQCALSVDGPLTRLFETNLSEQIYENFSLLALKI